MLKALHNTITVICIFTANVATSQLVSDETNAIHLNFKDQKDSAIVLPEIKWDFPSKKYTNAQEEKVQFKATIISSTPVKSIKLSVSRIKGTPLITKNIDFPENSVRFQLLQNVTLLDGENIITVEVENKAGAKVEDERHVLHGFDAISKAVDINRKDYGLFIATDKYDSWSDLVNPIFDSQTIKQELEENYNFQTEILENPNQEDILLKIKEYVSKDYKPQDQLMIFVAGHGQFDEGFGEGYLVAKNSLRNDEAKTSYIAHSVLRNAINNIPCDHILLVMDVCFSGTFDPVIARSRGELYEDINDSELLVRKLSKKTRRYLTSGGKEYVSDGIPGKHSPFAEKFLEVLRSRGGEDRIITLTEMYPTMQRLKTLPRSGEFGENEQDSDFVFVVK